jgi:hypothetical protein
MSPTAIAQKNFIARIILGHYGLARTYWAAYIIGAVLFFVFGSLAMADGNWKAYVIMLFVTIGYSLVLLLGIQAGYTGSDPGKALSRIAILFLLLNLTNALATLSFI